jgi:predicted tellurium resistance membrane protein TerC
MLELLTNPSVWAAFATLTVMEVVLGIDNIVFISVLVSRLPKEQADRARKLGLALALAFRIALLLVISWIIALDNPLFELFGHGFSWKDLILIGGGAFLLYKATHEMHAEIEEPHTAELGRQATMAFGTIIAQIIVIDMVFSVDSIITAVGMADHVEVMIAAVIVAVAIMFVASGPIANFVAQHPTTKMLALAFLVLVEAINILAKARRQARVAKAAPQAEVTLPTHTLAAEAAEAVAGIGPKPAAAAAPQPKAKTTPAKRTGAPRKSAPRRKK